MDDRENSSVVIKLVHELQQNLQTYKNKCKEYEQQLQETKIIENQLRNTIKLERLKLKICEKFMSVKLYDLFKEEEDGVHVYLTENDKIPVTIHNTDGTEEKLYVSSRKSKKSRKPSCNSPSKEEECAPKDFRSVENEIDKRLQELNNGNYTKKFPKEMKELHVKLSTYCNLNDYVSILKQFVERLKTIFTKKNYAKSKISSTISECLTPLDHHLIRYQGYQNMVLDGEDLAMMNRLLVSNYVHSETFTPVVYTDKIRSMQNYGLAFNTVKQVLVKALVNPHGFNNIVYMGVTTKSDPFTFYILNDIRHDIRLWKLDCRLMGLAHTFSRNLLAYCVEMFKHVYHDVFSDNMFRENFFDDYAICKQELKQLAVNIVVLSKPKSFLNMLKEIVIEHCSYVPTHEDEIDFESDDKMHRVEYQNLTDDNRIVHENLGKLFDNSTNSSIEKLYTQITES